MELSSPQLSNFLCDGSVLHGVPSEFNLDSVRGSLKKCSSAQQLTKYLILSAATLPN